MIRLTEDLQLESVVDIPYFIAGRSGQVERTNYSISYAEAELPPDVDAVIVLGDLQGVADATVPVPNRILVGIHVAETLGAWCNLGLLPPTSRTIICLTGDLYATPSLDARGGTGDVLPVYRAFCTRFEYVVAVAGNHDVFGSDRSVDPKRANGVGVKFLDGSRTEVLGIQISGVSGIEGTNQKVWRHDSDALRTKIGNAVSESTDLLLLHEPPAFERNRGSETVAECLAKLNYSGVTLCGHKQWSDVRNETPFGTVFNLENRGLIIGPNKPLL